MSPALEPLDSRTWLRGRGRRRSFPKLKAEHLPDLVRGLPVELGPYEIYSHDMVGGGRNHRSLLTRVTATQIPELRARGTWQFCIVSRTLSQAMLDGLESRSMADLAINGAVGVQFSASGHDGIDFTLTLTAVSDHAVVQHDDYERVYRAAVAGARRLSA